MVTTLKTDLTIEEICKGFIYNDYEIYVVVSEPERKIYIFDFKVIKEHYRKGEYKRLDYYDQFSDVYLVPIGIIKKYNGLINIIEY